jgi:hypothetical protein
MCPQPYSRSGMNGVTIYKNKSAPASSKPSSSSPKRITMFKSLLGQKREAKRGGLPRPGPVVATSYVSHPVDIPDDFLAPLPDPSVIKVEKVDFEKTPLPEYKDYYAVVIDNLLSKEECDDLIRLTEMSAGAHQEGIDVSNNGWKPAMVNAGVGYEFLALDYRSSDRIIWDQKVIAGRLWARVQQARGMKEYFAVLEGETYNAVRAPFNERVDGQRWEIMPQGINERLRFLKYGAGQFFKGMIIFVEVWVKPGG